MAGIGGTVADLLDAMSMLDNELDTEAGGVNEAQCIKALTHAQKYFETVAAMFPRVYQTGVTTISTAANTETTTYPSLLRRLDGIWLLDANNRPIREIERIDHVGGHVPSLPWPLQVTMSAGSGGPGGYYANMAQFYWLPLPDGVYNARIYGLFAQASFAARGDNYNYHDYTILALAQFAVKVLSIGVADSTDELMELADQLFKPLLRSLRKFDRTAPRGRFYGRVHDT